MVSTAVESAMDPAQIEREAIAKAQKERLQKRANIIANLLRKFMVEWNSAYMKELEAARAAAAAKAALKGKKKRKVKKPPPPINAKDQKKTKKPKTRMQEVWAWLLSSIDELINKQKRITLEDLYRGTELLGAAELVQLRNILHTANKKVLPTEMNLNQINIKQSLWAAAAAHEYSAVDRTLLYPVPALAVMRDKGLGAKQLQELGYKEGELLRVGFSAGDVCEVAPHDPARLRAAGLSVGDVVAGFGGMQSLPPDLQGFRGVQKLRAAGYSAADMVAGGMDNAWDLARAGFSASDVYSAGVPAEALRPAGFGLPELRPPSFLGPSLAVLQESDARLIPPVLEGTRGGIWPRLLHPQTATHKDHPRTTGGAFRLGAVVRNRPGTAMSSAAHAASAAAATSPTSTASGMVGRLESVQQRVAWPDPSASSGHTSGALPPPPNLSRVGSLAASVRSGM